MSNTKTRPAGRQAKRNGGSRCVQRMVGRAWAWKIKDESGNWTLCHWAEPQLCRLLDAGKPSPEARPVRVKLIPAKRGSERRRLRNG